MLGQHLSFACQQRHEWTFETSTRYHMAAGSSTSVVCPCFPHRTQFQTASARDTYSWCALPGLAVRVLVSSEDGMSSNHISTGWVRLGPLAEPLHWRFEGHRRCRTVRSTAGLWLMEHIYSRFSIHSKSSLGDIGRMRIQTSR
jgi:hypothetical protein